MDMDWQMLLKVLIAGIVATGVMDLWSALQRCIGVQTLDYALVGRWIGHWPEWRWRHASIHAAAPVAHESALGWGAHYVLGVLLAAGLWCVGESAWWHQPTPVVAILFGLLTVLLPFLILQPALGAGIAASRSPQPWRARSRSVATHAVFGFGLYLGAWLGTAL